VSKNISNFWIKNKKEIRFSIFIIITYIVCLGLFLSEYRLPEIVEFLITSWLCYLFWILVCAFIYKDFKIIEEFETNILNLFYR